MISAAVIFSGCASRLPKSSLVQTKVTFDQEPALFLPSSLGLSLFDRVEVTPPITTNTWQRFHEPMIEVHARPPNRTSGSFEFGYPRNGYRPEYLIDDRYQPQINLKDLEM